MQLPITEFIKLHASNTAHELTIKLEEKCNLCTCAMLVVPYLLSVSDIRHEEQTMNRTCNRTLQVEKHVYEDTCQDSGNPAVTQNNSETLKLVQKAKHVMSPPLCSS